MIKISIIIPVYNRPELLRKTLQSTKGIKNSEVIVVDDGSTIVNAQHNKRTCNELGAKYFIQKNQGVSVARNFGLSNARGKYVFFLDSDDTITDEMVSYLNSNPDFCDVERFNEIHCSSTNEKLLNLFPMSRKRQNKADLFNSYQISSYLFSFKVAEKINFYGSWGEDHHYLSDLLEVSNFKEWKINKIPSIRYKANEHHLGDIEKFPKRLQEFLTFSKSTNWHLANRFWLLIREANRFGIKDIKLVNFANEKFNETLKWDVFLKLPIYMKFIWFWRFLKFWDRKIIKSSN